MEAMHNDTAKEEGHQTRVHQEYVAEGLHDRHDDHDEKLDKLLAIDEGKLDKQLQVTQKTARSSTQTPLPHTHAHTRVGFNTGIQQRVRFSNQGRTKEEPIKNHGRTTEESRKNHGRTKEWFCFWSEKAYRLTSLCSPFGHVPINAGDGSHDE